MTQAVIVSYSPLGARGYQFICFTAFSSSFTLSGKLSYTNSSVDKGPIAGFYFGFNEIFNIESSLFAKAPSKIRFKERKLVFSIIILCWLHSSIDPHASRDTISAMLSIYFPDFFCGWYGLSYTELHVQLVEWQSVKEEEQTDFKTQSFPWLNILANDWFQCLFL